MWIDIWNMTELQQESWWAWVKDAMELELVLIHKRTIDNILEAYDKVIIGYNIRSYGVTTA